MKNIKKYALASLSAALSIPAKDLLAHDNNSGHQRLYGMSASLLDNVGARKAMKLTKLNIKLSDYTKDSNISSDLAKSARVWEKILSDEKARANFTESPYSTLKSLNINDSFLTDSYDDVASLRVILSPEAKTYLDNNDFTSFLNLLKNYGVIKESYPDLKNYIAEAMKKDPQLFSKSIEQLNDPSLNPEDCLTDDCLVAEPQIVANIAIFLNVAVVINLAVVSNIYSSLAAATDAIAFTNSSIWADGGGGGDLCKEDPEKCNSGPRNLTITLDSESGKFDANFINKLVTISKIDQNLGRTTEILLTASANNQVVFNRSVQEILKVQLRHFMAAALEVGLVSGTSENIEEALQSVENLIYKSVEESDLDSL